MTGLNLHLLEMIMAGCRSLTYDLNGNKKNFFPILFWFIFLPFLLSGLTYSLNWKFPNDSIGLIVSILGIFTALIFGVIFIAPDKFSQRIELYKDTDDDSINNYLIRFENFANSFVEYITLIIICAVFLILCMLTIVLFKQDEVKLIFSSISVVLSVEFIQLIFVLLSNIYILLKDDIRIAKQTRNKSKK